MEINIQELREWARLAGNHIFVKDLDRYIIVMLKPEFKDKLERRIASEGTNHTD